MTQEIFPEIKAATEALQTRIAITESEMAQLEETVAAKKTTVETKTTTAYNGSLLKVLASVPIFRSKRSRTANAASMKGISANVFMCSQLVKGWPLTLTAPEWQGVLRTPG